MSQSWERYRQLIQDDYVAYRFEQAEQVASRPLDAKVRAAAEPLMARFTALGPRMQAGGDEALYGDVEQLLRDHEALRDGQCAPGSRDWEDLQYRCNQLMALLASIALSQGHAGQARQWFDRAAEGWQALGNQASADECRQGALEAALADGADVDTVMGELESSFGGRAPARKAALHVSSARALLEAGDQAGARRQVAAAERLLNAIGFTDPVAAGSAEDAFTVWLNSGHREQMSALPWLHLQALLNSVAQTWAKLIGMRFRLGIMPLAEAQPLVDELWVLVRSLISEGVEADREARAAAGWTDPRPAAPPVDVSDASPRSIQQNVERGHRLLALHREAEQLGPQAGETDDLPARMAELEQEAALAGDGLTAGYAAIARADIYFGANRVRDAAAVLEVAHARLGDGDGLDVARRRTLLVQLLRRLARAAVLQKQFVLVSQLCGAAINGFEQERDRVYEPYRQDSYLRDRALIYELGVTAAWELDDLELVLVRADLAKARGALGWAASAGASADAPDQEEMAALRSEWSRFPHGQCDEDTIANRRALWSRLMTVQARARRAARPELRLAALQAALAPDEAILYYYFVSRETLVIYVITPKAVGAEWRNLDETRAHLDQFADRIQKLHEEIDPRERDWLDRNLALLSQHLLPREGTHLLDGARRLLICPHRILHHLPLHALDWQQAPLIERFAISYVPNVTSLLLTKPAPRSPAALCVGIDSFPSPLTDLPGAEEEADSIASIYRQQGAEATVLRGANASRAHLEQLRANGELEKFAVIHLVTHGNDHPAEEPGEAALLLADGSLDAMDISQWTLHADLIALSACWSGRRPVHVRAPGTDSPAAAEELFGDEVYGLQAAFFTAGARQVLGSLWPVINRTAPVVMKAFHAGVASSQPPEVALQDAVNQLRRTRRSVYHWAPYKLITLGRPTGYGGGGCGIDSKKLIR